MKISGFSYIRNGFTYEYPFLAAIQSVLPLCDEFCVAVGDSNDETREALIALNDPRIRIIDTVWDETMRGNGKIFAQQANVALNACTGDWLFHIQADEVIHERDLPIIRTALETIHHRPAIDGLLFDFLNFHGSYDYLNNTRKQHKKEIRVFRNGINAYAYRDSQGFRRYTSFDTYEQGEIGTKLRVKHVPVPVHHYSFVRPAEQMFQKWAYFRTFYGRTMDEPALHTLANATVETMAAMLPSKQYDYYDIFRIKRFEGTHPGVMTPYIMAACNDFDPAKIHHVQSLKDKLVYAIEDRLNYRFGEWKNYKLVNE